MVRPPRIHAAASLLWLASAESIRSMFGHGCLSAPALSPRQAVKWRKGADRGATSQVDLLVHMM